MRNATRRSPAWTLAALGGALVIPAALPAEDGGAATLSMKLPPGHAILFKGTAASKEIRGAETTERRFDAAALVFPREGSKGETRVFAVRTLVPAGNDAPASAMFEEIVISPREGGGAAQEVIEDPAPELEPGALILGIHFPLELVPSFPVPAPGAEARGEAEVAVAHLHAAKGTFVTGARLEGGALEVTRALAPGTRPEIVFDGSPAVLSVWRERYAADPGSGAPRRIERESVVEVKAEDGAVRLERKLVLEASGTLEPPGSEALERKLRELDLGFRSIPPADEMAKRVEALPMGLAPGPHLETPKVAAARRLAAFRELFEESGAGKKLASLLGKPAPDFTLEGLDGKKVGFREAIRGKVAFLTFWGVG
jgi:hypothetical protein